MTSSKKMLNLRREELRRKNFLLGFLANAIQVVAFYWPMSIIINDAFSAHVDWMNPLTFDMRGESWLVSFIPSTLSRFSFTTGCEVLIRHFSSTLNGGDGNWPSFVCISVLHPFPITYHTRGEIG